MVVEEVVEEADGTNGFAPAEGSIFDLFLFIGTRSVLTIVLTAVEATVLALVLAAIEARVGVTVTG